VIDSDGQEMMMLYTVNQKDLRNLYSRLLALQQHGHVDGEQVRQIMKQAHCRRKSAELLPDILRQRMRSTILRSPDPDQKEG
jgi:hypothetical protein